MDGLALRSHLDRIGRDGYTIVEGAIADHTADDLAADLGRLEEELAITPADNRFEGSRTIRLHDLGDRGPTYSALPNHPEVLAVVQGVLDCHCALSSFSSISILPNEIAQPIHVDDRSMPLLKPHPPALCNTMWALTDFTTENGATRVIPGTHLADHSPDGADCYTSIPAEMGKGGVLVWHGSLWHGGGANHSADRRVGLAMNYSAAWVRSLVLIATCRRLARLRRGP